MIDPIQAAIEKAEEALGAERHHYRFCAKCSSNTDASIRNLIKVTFSAGMDLGIGACEAATGIRLEYPPVPEEIRVLLPEKRP